MMTMMTTTALAGGGILAVAALLSLTLERASASLRHLVWSSALGALLLLPLLEASGARFEVPVPATWLAAVDPIVDDVPAPAAPVDNRVREQASRGDVGSDDGARLPAEAAGRAPADESYGEVASASGGRAAVPKSGGGVTIAPRAPLPPGNGAPTAAAGATNLPLGMIAAGLWGLGTVVFLLGTLVRHRTAHRLTRRRVSAPSASASARLRLLAAKSGIDRHVDLVVSEHLRVPATWGLASATVVLPSHYRAWSLPTLDRVLLHELAHVARRDCQVHFMGEVVRALYWPNPLCWIAVARQRIESERACDDRVLAQEDRASAYAQDLVGIARSLRPGERMPGASLAITRSSTVGERVRDILATDRNRDAAGPLTTLMVCATAVAVSMTLTLVAPVPGAGAVPATAATGPEPRDTESPAPTEATAADAIVPGAPAPEATPAGAIVPVATGPTSAAQEICVFRNGERRSTSHTVDESVMHIRWETDDCRVDVDLEGEIEFAPDDTGISAMSDGALFEIEERMGRSSRRVRLVGERGGAIERRFWVNGSETAWGNEADAWLASLLPELFRHTTINAEARVQRILAEAGPAGVFAEIDRMRSDHVRRVYAELMMEHAELDTDEYSRVIDIASDIDSDHNASELILIVVDRAGLRPAFQDRILRATTSIDSDHQKAMILQALVASDLSDGQLEAVLDASRTIDSDHQLGEILSAVARSGVLTDSARAAYMRALASIESDHQHAMVLGAFLDQGRLSADELSAVLDMTHGIESDHQRATVLQRIASEYPLTGPEVTAYLRAASGITSDHQLATTAQVIVDNSEMSPDQFGLVLALANEIESDHQRATLLGSVVERRALSGGEVDALLDVARGIASDHQLAEVLSLVAENEALDGPRQVSLLRVAEGIGSDHNHAEVLLTLARNHELSDSAIQRYRAAAETLSRSQRNEVLAALVR